MDLRRVFEATIQEHSVVFDIGAHVGFYTLLASTLVGPWPFTPEKSISSVARFFERSIMSSKRLTQQRSKNVMNCWRGFRVRNEN